MTAARKDRQDAMRRKLSVFIISGFGGALLASKNAAVVDIVLNDPLISFEGEFRRGLGCRGSNFRCGCFGYNFLLL